MDPSLELKIKKLIVEALQLEDIVPEEIDSEAPLFGEGLQLDSIDALELASAVEHHFGVKISQHSSEAKAAFGSVRALGEFVSSNQKEGR